MSTTAAAATIPAQPGFWVRRTVAGAPAEVLPVIGWSVPTTGAAEPIVIDGPGAHTTGTLSGNLSGTIEAVYFDPSAPRPNPPA